MTGVVEIWGLRLRCAPLLSPTQTLTMHVLSLNAGMILPRMASTHQHQGTPGAPTALPDCSPPQLQHLPSECPQQAAPASYGHLTLTWTAPGPDSSGQGCSCGGRMTADLSLPPALSVWGTLGYFLLPHPHREAARQEGATVEKGSLGESIEQPSGVFSQTELSCPFCVSHASPGHPVCAVCARRDCCMMCGWRDLGGGWILLLSLCCHS